MGAVAPMNAGIAGCLPALDAAEERLESAVYPLYHVLQDLGIDLAVLRHRFFDVGKLSLLPVVAHRDAALPPGLPTLADGGGVDGTAEHEGTIKDPLWFGSRLELVLVGLANALRFQVALFCPTDVNREP